MPSTANRLKLIVGVDYGTTYSGISFALSNAADQQDIVYWTKYPGAFSHEAGHSVKAPTRIALAEENEDLGSNAWGYQVEPEMESYSMTKLLLDESTLLSDFDDPDVYSDSTDGLMRLPEGKSARFIATEYLRLLYNMFEKSKSQLFGSLNLDELPVEFWLTVPASWSEKARLLTKCAAVDAGFGSRPIDSVMLISEPEAAAHYTLKSSIRRLDTFVQKGNGVMVCDCGGGTVDITTYEIEEVQPLLKLREIAVGVAGKCGATFIDRNFFKLMSDRFGEAFTSLEPGLIGPGSAFMNQFEQRKKDFSRNDSSRRAFRLSLRMHKLKCSHAMDKYYERSSSSVLLTYQDLKELFDPAVQKVLSLIENQVQQADEVGEVSIDTIALVGGFASSPYLVESVQSWCLDNNIRFTTPVSGAWSAIDGLEHLDGFMEWQISKGAKIDRDAEMICDVSQYVSGTKAHDCRLKLFSCNLDEPPDTIENPRVEIVGAVRFRIGLDHLLEAEKRNINGKVYYRVVMTVHTRLSDDSGHLVFRMLLGGAEIGRTTIALDE
ncbi:hypothetical protein V2A60_004750 [Cordyceps javanica]